MGRFLDWGAVDSRGSAGGIVVLWDNRVLEMIELEKGECSKYFTIFVINMSYGSTESSLNEQAFICWKIM